MQKLNRLPNLDTFILVVLENSFSSAARALRTTPSAISRQISQLESELGARLFDRTTRRIKLTEAGHILYKHGLNITEEIELAKAAVNQVNKQPSGTLTVSAEADFANAFLAPVISDYLNQYPSVNVQLILNSYVQNIFDSGVDLAIRMGQLPDSSFYAKKIGSYHSVVCASPSYLKKYGVPQHPMQLAKHKCLSFQLTVGRIVWEFDDKNEHSNVEVKPRMKVNSLIFLKELALSGEGIILVPSWLVSNEVANGTLSILLHQYRLTIPATPIHAVFPHKKYLAPKLKSFLDFISEKVTLHRFTS